MSVIVLLEMQVKPDAVDEMKSSLKKMLPDSRAFDGCQSIDIDGNTEDAGKLIFYERWESRKHHESYMAWRREAGAMDQTATMWVGTPSLRYFERIDV